MLKLEKALEQDIYIQRKTTIPYSEVQMQNIHLNANHKSNARNKITQG